MSAQALAPFVNAGGGCGDPFCDFQVQCLACARASERQYDAWFARAGEQRGGFLPGRVERMYEQAHADALAEDRRLTAAEEDLLLANCAHDAPPLPGATCSVCGADLAAPCPPDGHRWPAELDDEAACAQCLLPYKEFEVTT